MPERPEVKRSQPLTPQQWSQHMDQDGSIVKQDKLMEIIFRGVSRIPVEVKAGDIVKIIINLYANLCFS